MDKNDEVQPEQMEDYCRQLGLQLRDEQDNSAMPVEGTSQISVLGAAQQTQNQSENGQPIAPGHTKLEGTEKTHFECKKCEKSFTNSRQFLKHKCVLKSEGETQKSKGKKRGRKPRVKTSEATEPAGDETNVDMPKTSTPALVEDQTDHLSDHTYIKDGDNSQTHTPENTPNKIQCKSCQLLAEIDSETANNPDQIPCQKCQDLSTDGKMAEKLTEETGSLEESNKKRKYMFKSEQKNCPHCDKAFHSQKRFDKHILVCKKNLVCSFCNKDFSGSANGRQAYSQYQAHYYTHVETKPFTCTLCSRGFIRKADLDRHNIIHTDNYSPQRCIDCGAVFATKANLSKHMHKHDRITLPCKKCGQQFARQATLDKHVLVCQTQTSCDICGKVFKCLTKNLKSRYQEHMFIHTGEKPYKCQFCDRGFRDRSTRRKHERTHTGEKPYPCTVCDRAFSQLRLLRNHVRTHTGEKPYSCELCPLSFAKSCNLKYHMRVHTKEKPYSCGLCKRSFTQSGTYHKHMRRHTESEQVSATMLQFQVAKAESEDTDDIFVPKGEPGPEEEPGPNGDLLTNPSEQIIELRATMVNDSNPETMYDGCYDDDSTSDMVPEEIDTQIDDTTDVNPEATLDSTATIPEIPTMASDEITIIVSEEDGVTAATLATIDVDQISNILASCS